jgi:hypothetical protein
MHGILWLYIMTECVLLACVINYFEVAMKRIFLTVPKCGPALWVPRAWIDYFLSLSSHVSKRNQKMIQFQEMEGKTAFRRILYSLIDR